MWFCWVVVGVSCRGFCVPPSRCLCWTTSALFCVAGIRLVLFVSTLRFRASPVFVAGAASSSCRRAHGRSTTFPWVLPRSVLREYGLTLRGAVGDCSRCWVCWLVGGYLFWCWGVIWFCVSRNGCWHSGQVPCVSFQMVVVCSGGCRLPGHCRLRSDGCARSCSMMFIVRGVSRCRCRGLRRLRGRCRCRQLRRTGTGFSCC